MSRFTERFLPFLLLAAAFLFSGADAQRGEYIVKHVSMCIECHTPRDSKGNLIQSEAFEGAPIPVNAPYWATSWAIRSMNIRGFLNWNDEEATHFLETGLKPDGTRASPPMPQFRMNHQDAEDVIAYLRQR